MITRFDRVLLSLLVVIISLALVASIAKADSPYYATVNEFKCKHISVTIPNVSGNQVYVEIKGIATGTTRIVQLKEYPLDHYAYCCDGKPLGRIAPSDSYSIESIFVKNGLYIGVDFEAPQPIQCPIRVHRIYMPIIGR